MHSNFEIDQIMIYYSITVYLFNINTIINQSFRNIVQLNSASAHSLLNSFPQAMSGEVRYLP